MVPIYICEDVEREIEWLIKVVNGTIIENGLQERMKIRCATQNPADVLSYIKEDMQPAIYFLDVDLGKGVMNGIELGVNIRILDPAAYIVMITTHDEAAQLTYKFKIGAKDFLLKDKPEDIRKRVKECLVDAHEILSKPEIEKTKLVLVRKNGEIFTMYANQIYFIDVVQNKKRKLLIHENYVHTEVIATFNEVLNQLDESFCLCNKSCVINLNHVKAVDRNHRIVYMKNGYQLPISVRMAKKLEKQYLNFVLRE